MNVGDWVMIKARFTGRARRSNAVRLVVPSGASITVMESDVIGNAQRPQAAWADVKMGQMVQVVGRGEGRFVHRAQRDGTWFVSVLPEGGDEPRWFQQDQVRLV